MPTPIPPSIYDTVIKRIRDRCPIFSNRVGGSAELSTAYRTVATSDIDVPQCWVMPLYEGDESQSLISDLDENPQHVVAEYFSTIIAVGNAEGGVGGKELRGLQATAAIEQARRELRAALMGWRIAQRLSPVRLSRGDHLAMNAKYLWHVWEWRYTELVTPGQATELADSLARIVNGMNDMPPTENSVLPRIRQIHIGFNTVPLGQSGAKDSARDYFDERPVPAEPTAEQIAAVLAGQDDFIDVNAEEGIPPLPSSAEAIGEAVYRAERFDDFWLHGLEAEPTQHS